MESNYGEALEESDQFLIKSMLSRCIYDLIRMNSIEGAHSNSTNCLSSNVLEVFMKRAMPRHVSRVSQIMQSIDSKKEEIMTQKHFAKCISLKFCDLEISQNSDAIEFVKLTKMLMAGFYRARMTLVDRWDDPDCPNMRQQNFQDDWNVSQQTKRKQETISEIYPMLSPVASMMEQFTFQRELNKINYCMSCICMCLPDGEKTVVSLILPFINSKIMLYVSEFLIRVLTDFLRNVPSTSAYVQMDATFSQYFKFLSYMYGAMRIKEIRVKIEQQFRFFVEPGTFSLILEGLSINDPELKKQVSTTLALISKHCRQHFRNWVMTNFSANLMNLCSKVVTLADENGLCYGLDCLCEVLRCYKAQSGSFQQEHCKVVEEVFKYALETIKISNQVGNQEKLILIICEITECACELPSGLIESLSFINVVFQNSDGKLISAALKILERAIVKQKKAISNMILQDDRFVGCFQACLEQSDNPLLYKFLHVLLVLSEGNYLSYILEKDLLAKLLRLFQEVEEQSSLPDQGNPILITIVSQAIFNFIQQALDKEEYLTKLYEHYNLVAVFTKLLGRVFKKDSAVETFYFFEIDAPEENPQKQQQYNFLNKQILYNVFKVLYCLAVGVSRRNKKNAFSARITPNLLQAITEIFKELFEYEKFLTIEILRERLQILNCKQLKLESGIEFFKLLNTVFDEMTHMSNEKMSRKENVGLLRSIQHLKKTYCNNLCYFFKTHELEIENIPIFISVVFSIGDSISKKRDVPHKYELSSLKTYLKSFVAREFSVQETAIKDIVLRQQEQQQRLVENEVQYRNLVNKAIEQKEFTISLEVVDIKKKHHHEELSSSFLINGKGVSSTLRSNHSQQFSNAFQTHRALDNRNQNAHSNRFTQREPIGRATNTIYLQEPHLQYGQRKDFYSPNPSHTYRPNIDSRDPSPTFGNSCRKCHQKTLNRQLCKKCQTSNT